MKLLLSAVTLLASTYGAMAEYHQSCFNLPHLLFNHAEANTDIFVNVNVKPSVKIPVSILIYREKDKQLTSIPEDITEADINNHIDEIGICTHIDIKEKRCTELGKFVIKYNDDAVEQRIINEVIPVGKERTTPIQVTAGFGRYCYIYYLADSDNPEITKPDSKERSNVVTVFPITPKVSGATTLFILYYGRWIHVLVQLAIASFIYLRKLKSIDSKTSHTPYRYLFNMLLISAALSVIHVFYFRKQISDYITDENRRASLSRFYGTIRLTTETIEDIVVYVIAFQFLNLDRPGFKNINFRKNRYGYWFLGLLSITSILLPIALHYRYEILFSIVKSKGKGPARALKQAKHFSKMDLIFRIVTFINFSGLWYILYKISQTTETKLANNPGFLRRFKLTRIYVVSAAISVKFLGSMLSRYIFPMVYHLGNYIRSFHDDDTFNPEELLAGLILTGLKVVLCVLKNFDLFDLSLMTIITLVIWWTYDEKYDESIELPTRN